MSINEIEQYFDEVGYPQDMPLQEIQHFTEWLWLLKMLNSITK
jgi:hypothetical protein